MEDGYTSNAVPNLSIGKGKDGKMKKEVVNTPKKCREHEDSRGFLIEPIGNSKWENLYGNLLRAVARHRNALIRGIQFSVFCLF